MGLVKQYRGEERKAMAFGAAMGRRQAGGSDGRSGTTHRD